MSATPAHQPTGKRESCAGHSTIYRHDSTLEGYDNPIRHARNQSIRHFYKYDSFNDGFDNPLVGENNKVDDGHNSDVANMRINLPASFSSSIKSPRPEKGKVSAIRALFEDRVAQISKQNNDDIKMMHRRSMSAVGGFERYNAKIETSPASNPENIPYSRKDRVLVSPLVTQPVSSIEATPQVSSQENNNVVNSNDEVTGDKSDEIRIEDNAPVQQWVLELRDGRSLHLTETESGVIEVISTADDTGVVPERVSLFGNHRVPRQISLHEDDRMSLNYEDQSPNKTGAQESTKPNTSVVNEEDKTSTEERNTIDEFFDQAVHISQYNAVNNSKETKSSNRPSRRSMTKANADIFQDADVSMVDKLITAAGRNLISVKDISTSSRQLSVSDDTEKVSRTSSVRIHNSMRVRNSDVNPASDAHLVEKLIAAAGREVLSAKDNHSSSTVQAKGSDTTTKTSLSASDNSMKEDKIDLHAVPGAVQSKECRPSVTETIPTAVNTALSNKNEERDSLRKSTNIPAPETAATTNSVKKEKSSIEEKISATIAKVRQRRGSILNANVLAEVSQDESNNNRPSNMSDEQDAAVTRIINERYSNSDPSASVSVKSSNKIPMRKMSVTGKLGAITVADAMTEEDDAVKRIIAERYSRESVKKALIDSSIIAPKQSSKQLSFSDMNEDEQEDISHAIMRKSVEDDAVARIFVEQFGAGAAKRIVAESGIAERLSGGKDEDETVTSIDTASEDRHSDEKAALIALKRSVSKKKAILDSLKGRGSDDSNDMSDEEAFKRRSRDAEKALLDLKEKLVQEKTAEVLKTMEKEEALKQKADEESLALQALQKAVNDEAKRKVVAKDMYMSDKQREEESTAAIFALAVAMEEQNSAAARKKAEEERVLAATAKKKAEEEEAALIALMVAVQEETSLADQKTAEEEAMKKKAEEAKRLEAMQKKAEEYKFALKAEESRRAEAAKKKAEEDELALKAEEAKRLEAMQKKAGDYKLALKAEETRRAEAAKKKAEEDELARKARKARREEVLKKKAEEDELALKAAKEAKKVEAAEKKARQDELALLAAEEARKEEALKKKAEEVILASKAAEELRRSESMYQKAKDDELAVKVAAVEKARQESEADEDEDDDVVSIVPFSKSNDLEEFQIKRTELQGKKAVSSTENVEVAIRESLRPPKKKITEDITADRSSLSVKEMYLQAMRSVNYSSSSGRAATVGDMSDLRGGDDVPSSKGRAATLSDLTDKQDSTSRNAGLIMEKSNEGGGNSCDEVESEVTPCSTHSEARTNFVEIVSSSVQEDKLSNDGILTDEQPGGKDIQSVNENQTLLHDEVLTTATASKSDLISSSNTDVDNVEPNQNSNVSGQNDVTLTKFENDTKTNFGEEEEFLRPLSAKFSTVLSEMSVTGTDSLKKTAVEESKDSERDSSISSMTSYRNSSEASVNSHHSLFANVLKDLHLSLPSPSSSAPNSRVSSLQRTDSLNFLKDSTFGNDSRLLKSIMHSRYMTDLDNKNNTESTWTSSDDDSD